MPLQLKFEIDYPQIRVKNDRMHTMCNGNSWDIPNSSNMFVSPVCKTAMLMPLPLTPEWLTTFTGNYARLQVSDFPAMTAGDWDDLPIHGSGDHRMQYKGTVGTAFPTRFKVGTTPYSRPNQEMYFAFAPFNVGDENFLAYKIGWIEDGATTPTVELWIYSNGSVLVYRNGVRIAKESLGLGRVARRRRAFEATDEGEPYDTSQAEENTSSMLVGNNWVWLLLLPGVGDKLLVLTNAGDGFEVEFDLTEKEDVVGANHYMYWQPVNGKPFVQMAYVSFKSSGYLIGQESLFQSPPVAGQSNTIEYNVFADTWMNSERGTTSFTRGTVSAAFTDSTNFTTWTGFNGVKDTARLKVTVTGTNDTTPYIYAATALVKEVATNMPDATFDLTPHVHSAELTATDNGNGAELTIRLMKAAEVEAALGASHGLIVSNYPVRLLINGWVVFSGSAEPVDFEDAHNPTFATFTIKAKDRFKSLANYYFDDTVPLDGLSIKESFELLLGTIGFGGTGANSRAYGNDVLRPDGDIFYLDGSRVVHYGNGSMRRRTRSRPAQGEFAHPVERGSSSGGAIKDIADLFLIGGAHYFFADPNNRTRTVLHFRDRENIDMSSKGSTRYKLYYSDNQAKLANKHAVNDVFLDYKIQPLEILANRVIVTGRDTTKMDGVVQSIKNDYDSQWPMWLPADRPINWLGDIRKYAYYNSRILGQEMCNDICELIYDQVTKRTYLGEFSTFVPIHDKQTGMLWWFGDKVELQGRCKGRIQGNITIRFSKWPYRTTGANPDNFREPIKGSVQYMETTYGIEVTEILNETAYEKRVPPSAGSGS